LVRYASRGPAGLIGWSAGGRHLPAESLPCLACLPACPPEVIDCSIVSRLQKKACVPSFSQSSPSSPPQFRQALFTAVHFFSSSLLVLLHHSPSFTS
jgi:hypothetical protein